MGNEIRKADIDVDNHAVGPHNPAKNPCFRCGRDMKGKKHCIHVIDGGANALHPEDELKYVSDAGDMGAQYVGPDCMRKIGKEFEYR